MFFLLRSIFWLAIVFTSMSWGVGDGHESPRALTGMAMQGGLAVANAAQQAAAAGIAARLAAGMREQAGQILEKQVLSNGSGSNQTPEPDPKTRLWCTKAGAVCARDAALLTTLIARNQTGSDASSPRLAPRSKTPRGN